MAGRKAGVEIGDGLNYRAGGDVEAGVMDEAALVFRPDRIGVDVEKYRAAVGDAGAVLGGRDDRPSGGYFLQKGIFRTK